LVSQQHAHIGIGTVTANGSMGIAGPIGIKTPSAVVCHTRHGQCGTLTLHNKMFIVTPYGASSAAMASEKLSTNALVA
jgi:hypothetical protein